MHSQQQLSVIIYSYVIIHVFGSTFIYLWNILELIPCDILWNILELIPRDLSLYNMYF